MVEWKPLNKIVSSISTGLNPRTNFVLNEKDADLFYVTVKEITSNKVVFSESTDKITLLAKEIINKRSKLEKGDILFSGIGTIGKVAYVDMDTDNWDCSESVFLIKPIEFEIIGKFLYYVLTSNIAKSQYEKGAAGAIMKGVRKKTLENIEIPVPSLADQERIVDILDTFTTSIDNLREQIAQRRKQYACLIDECFGGNYKKLMDKAEVGEISVEPLSKHGTFIRGRRFVRTDIVDEGQPCIHYGDMYTYYGLCADKAKTHLPSDFPKKMRYAERGDIVIVGAGENNEDIGVGLVWQGEEPAAVHDACYIYKTDLCPMYVSYFLRSGIYHLQIKSNVVRGKICSISSEGIGRALIPIYTIERQERIVQMLYPFEALLSNLEKQLALRQKQYEFYRNKLLTFD